MWYWYWIVKYSGKDKKGVYILRKCTVTTIVIRIITLTIIRIMIIITNSLNQKSEIQSKKYTLHYQEKPGSHHGPMCSVDEY